MNSANDNGESKVVSSLREMPRSIAPPRDLWAGIEASIAADRQASAADPTAAEGSREQRLDAYRAVRDQILANIRQRFIPRGPGNE